jgi:DNA-binding HxlR family transcriptional regulator
MPTPSLGHQAVDTTLALLAPKGTVRILHALAHADGPLRVNAVTARTGLAQPTASRRLGELRDLGLLSRAAGHTGGYRLTPAGAGLIPVTTALASWSRAHSAPAPGAATSPTGEIAHAEQALRRLAPRHTTAVLRLLSDGPLRFTAIAGRCRLDNGLAAARLARLQDDGLVTRTSPHHGAAYALSPAARALGPVHAAVQAAAGRSTRPAGPAPAQALRAAPAARTAVALSRSPARPAAMPPVLFSHPAQPPTPTAPPPGRAAVRPR